MNDDMVDLMIHVDELLSPDSIESVRDVLFSQQGVMAAACNIKTPHLIVVEYDPGRANSLQLLQSVTRQGLHARLVGL